MNEPDAEPKIETHAEAVREPVPDPGGRRRWSLPVLVGVVAWLILAGAVGVLWMQVSERPAAAPVDPALASIAARLTKLEQAPPAPAGPAAEAGPDLTPRVEALERRAAPDLSGIMARLSALEQRPPGDTAALAARIGLLEQSVAHADRAARALSASMALNAGRPLGDMTKAPAALARFAHTAPPTEAGLRLAFPAAAEAALSASRPADQDRPMMDRLLARAENLVTVRQGDRVLVGDSAAGVLIRARTSLDAGDLDGTIAALGRLQGGAAAAMAGWVSDATALRDARAALAEMAAQP
jgi:hypothetical protein